METQPVVPAASCDFFYLAIEYENLWAGLKTERDGMGTNIAHVCFHAKIIKNRSWMDGLPCLMQVMDIQLMKPTLMSQRYN